MNKSFNTIAAVVAFTATHSASEASDPERDIIRFRMPNGEIVLVCISHDRTYSHRNNYIPPPAFPTSPEVTRSLASFLDNLSTPFHLSFDPEPYWRTVLKK